jgi:type IV pilus assembly protein PilA
MSPTQHSKTPRGFSVMELMIVVAILLIVAAIEIPNLLRARIAANQAAAVAALRAIETAEITYAVTYNHGYTSALDQLGPSNGPASPQAADLIDSRLAGGEKGGYLYVYVPGTVVDGKIDTYTLKAVPSTPCVTGLAFYSMAPSNQTTITAESFTTAVEKDFIAQVLIGSMESDSVGCTQ